MAFPKHSILQALSVLLLAWVLVRCQAPLEPEKEEEEEIEVSTVVKKPESIECPPECSCTSDGAVDCAGVDLKEFPSELSGNTRQLSLQVFHTTAHTHRCLQQYTSTFYQCNTLMSLCIYRLLFTVLSPDARTIKLRR